MEPNPALDEATAVAMSMAINNHIETLKVWQRKLQQPYLPTNKTFYCLTPQYSKPTLVSALHILESCSHARMNLGLIVTKFVKARNAEEV